VVELRFDVDLHRDKDAAYVPPMIMAFPALIHLDFGIVNENDVRTLPILCETLSAPHAPRLEALHLQLPTLN
jgi:hypothetical protein